MPLEAWIGDFYQEEDTYQIVFCNRGLHPFIYFYHAFTTMVMKKQGDLSDDHFDRLLDTPPIKLRDKTLIS